jgi:teichuronic acid biosynthesis glycosyltransferase TuaG
MTNKLDNKGLVDELVSVITPAYNAERFLPDTIRSVLAQTYEKWEMIIVDDCSADDTLRVAREYSEADSRIRVTQSEKNGGPAHAWNLALREARGRYVAFLDADDLWEPVKLEEQLDFMNRNGYGFTYAMYDWIGENDEPLGKTIRIPDSQNYKDILKNTVIGALTVVLDRERVDVREIPEVQINDSMMWLQIAREGAVAHGYQKILGHYRIVSTSFSRNKKSTAKGLWRLYRDQLEIPLLRRSWYFACYAWNSIKRYYLQ